MRFGGKGASIPILTAVLIVVLALAIRSFFLIVVAAALAAVIVLHFWNKRPMKKPEDDQVRLHLDD